MKPPGNLTRYTPLARGAALQRRTPLEPGKGLKRSPFPRHQPQQRDRKPARKRPSRAGEDKARKLVYARSGGWCEVRLVGICFGLAASWHHRLNRSQGGRWLATHGLHTCGSGSTGCHGTLTNPPPGRRAEFEAAGWITTTDPAAIDVLVPVELVPWRHALPEGQEQVLVLLTDDGRYLPAGEKT